VFIQQQQPVLSPGFNQPVMTAPVSRVVINTGYSPVRNPFCKTKVSVSITVRGSHLFSMTVPIARYKEFSMRHKWNSCNY
jgi:hypothetical protein